MTRPTPTSRRPVALITGASSGIGRDLAILFAQGGHNLVLVARSADSLAMLVDDVRERFNVRAAAISADLSDPESPEVVMEAVRERAIDVDVLVNNAGVGLYGAFADTDLATELRMIQLNVASVTHLAKRCLPPMLAQRRGRILNVASTAAFQPGPKMSVYYATKAHVLSWSEALSEELRGSGVTVTCLCPGPTRTAFQTSAGMVGARLFRGPAVMDSAAVARAGYEGLMRGDRLVIPGAVNKTIVQSLRLAPRRLVTRIAGALNDGA